MKMYGASPPRVRPPREATRTQPGRCAGADRVEPYEKMWQVRHEIVSDQGAEGMPDVNVLVGRDGRFWSQHVHIPEGITELTVRSTRFLPNASLFR